MPPLVHETPKVSPHLRLQPSCGVLQGGRGAMAAEYASHVPEKAELAEFRAACFLGVDSVNFRRVHQENVLLHFGNLDFDVSNFE